MKLITAILALVITAASASAQTSVTLTWERSPEPDVTGYRVYQKTVNPPPAAITWKLIATVPVTPTPATPIYIVQGLAAGTVNTWTVTAFNGWMESDRSNECAATILKAPRNVTVKPITETR